MKYLVWVNKVHCLLVENLKRFCLYTKLDNDRLYVNETKSMTYAHLMQLRIPNEMLRCRGQKKPCFVCLVLNVQYAKLKFPLGFDVTNAWIVWILQGAASECSKLVEEFKMFNSTNGHSECLSIHHAIEFYLFFILEFSKRIMLHVLLFCQFIWIWSHLMFVS